MKFNIKSLLLLFVILSFTQKVFAEEKIGSVNKFSGELKAINKDGEERALDVYDDLFLLDEIITSSGSATVQFNDNSTIIFKKNTSFKVTEFNLSGAKDIFIGEVMRGSVVIESGKIAKNDSGLMRIKLPKMDLEIKGTRFNVNNKPDGTSEVALSEDSFGNVGTINIATEGEVKTLYTPDQVVVLNEDQGFTERPQSDEEKQSFQSVSEDLVESSKIDENEIQKQLEKKLLEGKLEDADGDGKIDLNDIEAIKTSIKAEKQANIDFIVDNSKEDNTAFLSEVLNSSDQENIGEVINKIVENNDNLVSQVVSDLSDKDNTFITGSDNEASNQIKEKVFEKIVQSGSEKSASVLSKVIAKSDPKTIESVITNITTKNTEQNSALSLKVMADLAEKNPEALEVVNQNNKEQMEKLVVDAVQKGSTDAESANLIAKVVAKASAEVTDKMISEVTNNSSGQNSDLSAKVLKAIVETAPEKIETIDNTVKEKVIEQAIVTASNNTTQNIDFGEVISEVIVKTDSDTAAKVMEKISNSDDKSGLALKVISSVSEKDNKKLDEIIKEDAKIVDSLIEKSVKDSKGTDAEVKLISKVISKSNNNKITEKILVEASKKVVNKNSLVAKVTEETIKENNDLVESLVTTISTNAEINQNLTANEDPLIAESIKTVFDKNVSPN